MQIALRPVWMLLGGAWFSCAVACAQKPAENPHDLQASEAVQRKIEAELGPAPNPWTPPQTSGAVAPTSMTKGPPPTEPVVASPTP